MKIITTNRSADVHAQVEGRPEIWGCGPNRNAAIGDLISGHPELFDVQFDNQSEQTWQPGLRLKVDMVLSNDLFDDIMVTALEGGINYWCDKCEAKDGDFCGAEFVSEVIGRGGTVILHPDDETGEEPKELTAAMVEAACQALVGKPDSWWFQKLLEGDLDANDADTIIQQAVFGEQVFA